MQQERSCYAPDLFPSIGNRRKNLSLKRYFDFVVASPTAKARLLRVSFEENTRFAVHLIARGFETELVETRFSREGLMIATRLLVTKTKARK